MISILSYVTDTRLEERKRSWNTVNFYIRSFFSDWWGILKSIGGLPALAHPALPRLLLLTAESWEAGTHMRTLWLGVGSVAAMITTCLFIFFGQHLDQVGRGRGWSEQLARSRIVLFGTLLAGMMSLWVMLFAAILAFSFLLPASVTSGWTGFDPADLPCARYAAFLASIGILVAALGGNLEEEDAIKAELFFDQEV